jgi:tRNA pseudouridine38-40 synthase
MTRWKLIVEYDGRNFVGWQRQDNGPSIQQALEEAVEKLAHETVRVHGSGRTDAGVHALGQVAHFDLGKRLTERAIRDGLNYHLHRVPISVLHAEEVSDDFHARASAKERGYAYRIVNRRAPLALDDGRAWQIGRHLDAEAMHEAAKVLLGRHDFTTFRASMCQAKSPVKTLDVLTVTRSADEIRITARARSFLHHQIRNITGTLTLVGEGRWSIDHVREALEARDRSKGGPTAPPDGLYFTDVVY